MKTRIAKPDPVSHTIQHKTKAANQAPMSKLLQAYKDRTAATVQHEAMEEDDELLQGKFETAQRETLPEEDEEPLQQKAENKTGLPDDLKAGVESMSGYSMDDVRVHYNSSKPAQLQALAYTQGTEIHVGPGQEKHLPHEAWHVVQQKQGRVQPTVQMQGVQVNDDEGLEKEADVESEKIFQYKTENNVIQRRYEAGFGHLWHVHIDHVKYNGDDASRINFLNRTKSYILRKMRNYHNTLAHNYARHLSYRLCRRWVKDNL